MVLWYSMVNLTQLKTRPCHTLFGPITALFIISPSPQGLDDRVRVLMYAVMLNVCDEMCVLVEKAML